MKEHANSLMAQAENAPAARIRRAMENYEGNLPAQVRPRLAKNLGLILDQVMEARKKARSEKDGGEKNSAGKQGGRKKRDTVLRDIARESFKHTRRKSDEVDDGTIKWENELAYYRIRPDDKRLTDAKLRADPRGYLNVALAAVPYIPAMTETQVVLELTRDVSHFDLAANRMETDSEPAVRVAELLRARLKEVELRHGLVSYFRDVYALRAMPPMDSDTGGPGWKCDLGGQLDCFEYGEIWTWPSVLLTAIVRDAVSARLTIDGEEEDGEVAWVEHVSLTLGYRHGCVVPYLRFDSNMGIWPTGDAWWRYHDAPWFWPGFPPPTGASTVRVGNRSSFAQSERKITQEVSFIVLDDKSIGIPDELAKDASRRYYASTLPPMVNPVPTRPIPGSDGKFFQRTRLERIDAGTITKWLTGYRLVAVERQYLPRKVDPAAILCPPDKADTALALIEGVLLGREAKYDSSPNHGVQASESTFLEGLDRMVALLTASFRAWRAAGHERAMADHGRLHDESRKRAEDMEKGAAGSDLTGGVAFEDGGVAALLPQPEKEEDGNGTED